MSKVKEITVNVDEFLALYKIDENGAKSFDYAGCLECGTCRIACGGTIVEKWENPQPTMGVEYRFG